MTNFTARTDRSLVRAGARSTRHVLLQATAPKHRTAGAPKRSPVNVAFVLDRSGSMGGTKLALAKYAVKRALTGLAPKDRFAIVTYDDQVETVVSSTLATPANKTKALLRLQDVDARGSTDLHGGWTAGADALKAHLTPDGVNRCLLLTDGLAGSRSQRPSTRGLKTACIRTMASAAHSASIGLRSKVSGSASRRT